MTSTTTIIIIVALIIAVLVAPFLTLKAVASFKARKAFRSKIKD